MERELSLPFSKDPVTAPCPDPDEYIPHTFILHI
jgi:hypothetical protein